MSRIYYMRKSTFIEKPQYPTKGGKGTMSASLPREDLKEMREKCEALHELSTRPHAHYTLVGRGVAPQISLFSLLRPSPTQTKQTRAKA